jgi:hypothetical protein
MHFMSVIMRLCVQLFTTPGSLLHNLSGNGICLRFSGCKCFKQISDSMYMVALFLFLVTSPFSKLEAQITSSGCLAGDFGIDAGLYSGAIEFGAATPAAGSNDWFQGSSGFGVINQTSAASIQNLLQSQSNPLFTRRMAYPSATIIGDKILIDAVWSRDHFGGTQGIDQTAYTSSAKNGQDPGIWPTGPQNALGKNDLIDVAGHMFRKGTDYYNSDLWFVGLINRAEPGGTSYMDFEFYQAELEYNPSSGFGSGGPQLGHTAYAFEPDPLNPGKHRISQLGDFIFNVSLINGGIDAVVEVRLWVSRQDYLNITPSTFSWGSSFDGPFSGSPFGYAVIIPNTSNVCGIVNVANQSPVAPPWGTRNTKSNVYGTTYQEYSVVEVGINLTDFGIDHLLLQGGDPCFFPINTFMVKTRASASFTAQLKDFAGPFSWGQPEVNTAFVGPATLSCDNDVVQLAVLPNRSDVTYQWTTVGGNIISDPTQRVIQVNRPGTYTAEVLLPTGCAVITESVTVTVDNTKPLFRQPAAIQATTACNGNNGSLSVSVQGGTAPYTFTITKDGLPFTVVSGNSTGSITLTGLSPGVYQATVKGLYACTIQTAAIQLLGKTPIELSGSVSPVDCFGNRTGAVDVTVIGGRMPLTFQWSNGNLTEDISNLRAGSYSVSVTDGDGCITQQTFEVTQPARLLASIAKQDDTDVNTIVGNGSMTVSPSGGSPEYNFSWTGPNGFTANTPTITGLTYGQYSVAIVDANGCTFSTQAFIFEPEICNDGIDNDGNGLVDCQDPACSPLSPSLITQNVVLPCVGETVTYSVVNDLTVEEYIWTVPANATLIDGQGTSQISLVWNTDSGGQVCVKSVILGCIGPDRCLNVLTDDVPVQPTVIIINNN